MWKIQEICVKFRLSRDFFPKLVFIVPIFYHAGEVFVMHKLFYDMVYHIIIVLFPITIYQNFLKEDHKVRKSLFSKFLLLLLLVLVLTMSNPVVYAEGFRYDFRVIPIIFAFLYAGLFPGLFTVTFMLVYRFFDGGGGFYVTLINYIIATILLILIMRKYDTYSMSKRIFMIGSFYWTIASTRAISLIQMGETKQLPFMLVFSILTFGTIIILVFMIENINKQFAMNEELARSERLNVVSQLAASFAHEVRNPLTSIKGFMQLLKEDHELSPLQKNYLNIALEEINRTEAIIHEYLSLAKPTSAHHELINLSNEIKSTVELITSFTNAHNIVIHSSIENELYIKGKKGELKQVLINIIKNGVEATPPNGTLTILAYNQKSNHVIEIIDTGVGMTEQQIKRLGTPFYSTKDRGTGVGLSISYNIIRNMNGTIEVVSEKNKGSKFMITVPIHEPFIEAI